LLIRSNVDHKTLLILQPSVVMYSNLLVTTAKKLTLS